MQHIFLLGRESQLKADDCSTSEGAVLHVQVSPVERRRARSVAERGALTSSENQATRQARGAAREAPRRRCRPGLPHLRRGGPRWQRVRQHRDELASLMTAIRAERHGYDGQRQHQPGEHHEGSASSGQAPEGHFPSLAATVCPRHVSDRIMAATVDASSTDAGSISAARRVGSSRDSFQRHCSRRDRTARNRAARGHPAALIVSTVRDTRGSHRRRHHRRCSPGDWTRPPPLRAPFRQPGARPPSA